MHGQKLMSRQCKDTIPGIIIFFTAFFTVTNQQTQAVFTVGATGLERMIHSVHSGHLAMDKHMQYYQIHQSPTLKGYNVSVSWLLNPKIRLTNSHS